MAHLDENKILSDNMHSEKRIAVKQLTKSINDWARILDKGGQVDTFILDFEKAFDPRPLMNYLNINFMAIWYRWEDSEMDRFFSLW